MSGLPVYVRGSIFGGASEISKAQFSKLLKQACFAFDFNTPFLVWLNFMFFSLTPKMFHVFQKLNIKVLKFHE